MEVAVKEAEVCSLKALCVRRSIRASYIVTPSATIRSVGLLVEGDTR